MNVLEVLINKTLASPEFAGFIKKPQMPNEAEEVFGLISEANPLTYDDPRQNVEYGIFAPQKPLAGFVARGATEYSRIGNNVVDMFFQGVAKIGVEHSYTSEDVAAINMYQARFNGSVIDNYQAFLNEISMNPIKLTDSIANTVDVSSWFGQDVVEDLRINKGSQKVNVPDSQINVFKERLKVYGLVCSIENEKIAVDNSDKDTKKALFAEVKELGLKPEFNATIEQLKAMIVELIDFIFKDKNHRNPANRYNATKCKYYQNIKFLKYFFPNKRYSKQMITKNSRYIKPKCRFIHTFDNLESEEFSFIPTLYKAKITTITGKTTKDINNKFISITNIT